MIQKYSFWTLLCSFINLYENGETITRQDMILHLQNIEVLRKNTINQGRVYVRSMDVYRRYLTKAGYLKDTDTKGVYEKIDYIPLFTLSMNQVRKKAYGYGIPST